jgi:hypothetical protein
MRNRITSHLRGNAVAYVALFTALGGTSYAAIQLSPGSVTSKVLANGAVTHSKLAPRSVYAGNLAKRQLTADLFKPGALTSALRGAAGATGATGKTGGGGGLGPAGPSGAVGGGGPMGPAGHDGSASVALRARMAGTGVTAPHGSATNVPLTAGSWTQAANDVNLVTGAITIAIPATCTGSFGNSVVMSVDGIPNTFALAPTAPANTTVTVPLVVSEVMEPGADKQHTVTARVQNSCTKSGEDYTITDAKLDVVNFH